VEGRPDDTETGLTAPRRRVWIATPARMASLARDRGSPPVVACPEEAH
jgi:hypothetical protein